MRLGWPGWSTAGHPVQPEGRQKPLAHLTDGPAVFRDTEIPFLGGA